MASTQPPTGSNEIIEILKEEYTKYLAAQDRRDTAAVESFMSPTCRQLARQNSAWNLASRAEIMKILSATSKLDGEAEERIRGKVEMRALTQEERDTLPEDEKEEAAKEGWEGMRVLLEDAGPDGRRVEVNYYWRKEEGQWLQCFHDLLFVGPKDPDAVNDFAAKAFSQG